LLAAGLPVVDVTLRTPAALEAIRLLRRERPQVRALAGLCADTGVKFVPLGGVGRGNLVEYLALLGVSAVCGCSMLEHSLIRWGRVDEIERLAREAVVLARS
jgi:2-keto-3-deoxy-6-phosphogluconate aldolase